jgi:asparagine synthase (glutamine-hydrolysing)
MCGFAGIYKKKANRQDVRQVQLVLNRMVSAIHHRGPDGVGIWSDTDSGMGLAHKRLSIIDLSPTGDQPMESHCQRYIISYNGEIYNYKNIRYDLENRNIIFKGTSDTEVLLESIAIDGLLPTLQKTNGMFAFALWDKKNGSLHLARDRIGKKPLYFGWAGNDFVFCSELKCILKHPEFRNEIDYEALTLFLKYRYIPFPYSIYKGIYKLKPGTIVSVTKKDIEQSTRVEDLYDKKETYWSAEFAVENSIKNLFMGSEKEATDNLDTLLSDATKSRMMSDVPLGALLSGGIDSSTVVSLMQKYSSMPVKTFSLGFEKEKDNEAIHAKKIAEYLGTDHTELFITDHDALSVIPKLPEMYDEPFADSSQIPTFLLSKLAKSNVTVALSGDGGDELFCGYTRYFRGAKIYKRISQIPLAIRSGLSSLLKPLTFGKTNESRLIKFISELKTNDPLSTYLHRVFKWRDPAKLVLNGNERETEFYKIAQNASIKDPIHLMMFTDLISYLTDDILVKVDRASMAVSLELRNPILDHRVVEFAFSLPLSMKADNKNGKKILRLVLKRYVPETLTDRPKQGFGPPVRSWLNGSLKDWAEDLLSADRLKREGIFDVAMVRNTWSDFTSGKQHLHGHVWTILMFQAWNIWQKGFSEWGKIVASPCPAE